MASFTQCDEAPKKSGSLLKTLEKRKEQIFLTPFANMVYYRVGEKNQGRGRKTDSTFFFLYEA